MAQKVGRGEKLAQKVGRREIYSPVPPPSLCLGKTEKAHEHTAPPIGLVDANREWAKETCNICG